MKNNILKAMKIVLSFAIEVWFTYMAFTLAIISASFLLEIDAFFGVLLIATAVTLIPKILKNIKSHLAKG